MAVHEAKPATHLDYGTLLSFERIAPETVRVTFERGAWWWKKVYTATFTRSLASHEWFWQSSGVPLTLASKAVWAGLDHALEKS